MCRDFRRGRDYFAIGRMLDGGYFRLDAGIQIRKFFPYCFGNCTYTSDASASVKYFLLCNLLPICGKLCEYSFPRKLRL